MLGERNNTIKSMRSGKQVRNFVQTVLKEAASNREFRDAIGGEFDWEWWYNTVEGSITKKVSPPPSRTNGH